MSNLEDISKLEEIAKSTNRTRRNLFKAGVKLGVVVGGAAILTMAKSKPAAAFKPPGGPCFMKGTMIKTVDCDRRVEDLAVGDLLPTKFAGDQPIQWVGRYSRHKSDPSKSWVKDALPVRVACSALAPNVPHTDLFVTQSHALFFEGVLVPAGSLINGTTITLYDAHEYDVLEFYHIKLENHDVIYAAGAPCETLLEVNENAANFAEYFRMYGAPTSKQTPCLPRLAYNGGLSEIKSRLRSALSPWVDRREKIDIVRDRLEEHGVLLS